ncbi:hypothetical protein OROGR_010605 [Orobanche gracilis]
MEEWTELRDGGGNGNFRFDFNLDFPIEKYRFDPCEERLRGLFDQLLVAFMKDKSTSNCIRPIPALCGDGRPIDLFKLFWVVRKIGGHDVVSGNNMWVFVSEECGFSVGDVRNMKLIHMKYLNEFDHWLRQVASKRSLEHENGGLVRKLDLLSREWEIRCTNLLRDEQKEDNSRCLKDISDNELQPSPTSKKLRRGNDCSAEHIICRLNEACVDIDGNINDFPAAPTKRAVKKALAKRMVKKSIEKAVNGADGTFRGQVDFDGRKSCNEDDGNIMTSAKKVIEKVTDKVFNCEGAISINDEKLSIQDNSRVRVSVKKVFKNVISKTHDLSENIIDDKDRVGVQRGICNVIPAKSDVGKVLYSRKRKRQSQSFSEMLNWLIHVAKHPDDPSVGKIPECSKWSDYGNEELWVQAMLAREALVIRRQAGTVSGENLLQTGLSITGYPTILTGTGISGSLDFGTGTGTAYTGSLDFGTGLVTARFRFQDKQNKLRMHPSIYQDDALDQHSTEKLSCRKGVPTLPKSRLYPCCISNAAQSETTRHQEANKVNSPKSPAKLVIADVDELPKSLNHSNSSERQVSVGPLFQAQVPEWTGVILGSDSKWLGTRMWPPKDGGKNSITIRLKHAGKGRQHSCDCQFPNSVECVRFHVAEKRLKLKRNLGSLFYRWRFDRMGEEVSLSWTEEEEKKFKDMMRSYAAFPNKFWNNAISFLPSKMRENMVSYYFNVFLVHRRSYQNRVTPEDVDSDDDEKECGSIGGFFGYKALYVPGSSFVSCTLNKESYELV